MRITRVRTVTCDMPLPRPIQMGEVRFSSREYVLVILETDEGVTGLGFGMTRSAPVGSIVDRNLAPLLLGEDPLLTERLWERLFYANLTISGRGIFMRALSAVDIALWDIKGKVARQPIWRLLGGARERVPAVVAGGYLFDGSTTEELAHEVDDYATRGFSLIKIAAGEVTSDERRLRAALEAIHGRAPLAYDAHWAWRTLYDVVPTVRTWNKLGLAFIEDPFAPELVSLAPRLREATGIPVALGEDAVGRWAFDQLYASCRPDVLRIDATTMGGISEAAKVCALAATWATPVLPHVFPEIHVHLGAAYAIVQGVEMTVPEAHLESLHLLFRAWVELDAGELSAPGAPGLGMDLDEVAVQRYAVASTDAAAH